MDDTPRLRISGAFVGQWFCLLSGGLLLGIALFSVASQYLSAPAWATVEGRVTQAQVNSDTQTQMRFSRISRRLNGSTRQVMRYSPDVIYQYRVAGRDYTGFGIGDGGDYSYDTAAEAAAAVAPYRRASVTVYYDPADPGHSCLDARLFWTLPLWLGGIGLLLLCLGMWLRRRHRDATDI